MLNFKNENDINQTLEALYIIFNSDKKFIDLFPELAGAEDLNAKSKEFSLAVINGDFKKAQDIYDLAKEQTYKKLREFYG